MRYSVNNIIYYLKSRKLINQDHLFSKLRIEDIEGRNYSLIVKTKNKTFFIKQLNEKENRYSLYNEQFFYHLIKKISSFDKYLVEFIDFNEYENVLILEKISGLSLDNIFRNSFVNNRNINTDIFTELGKALALLHFQNDLQLSGIKLAKPRIPTTRRGITIDQLKDLGPAQLEILKIIQQQKEFGNIFNSIKLNWENNALIHNDIKGSNILVINKPTKIKLIDWELAGVGDFRWDLGFIFCEFIRIYLFSYTYINNKNQNSNDHIIFSLTDLKNMVQKFWSSYVNNSPLTISESKKCLLTSAKYCSAQLVLRTFEDSLFSNALSIRIPMVLSLTKNLFTSPFEYFLELFGLPL